MKVKNFSKFSDKRDVSYSIDLWLRDNPNVKIKFINIWGHGEYEKAKIIYE